MDRKALIAKYKRIETVPLEVADGEPLPQNKIDAVNYYNEALRNLQFGNEDIARIKLKKARGLDPDLEPAAALLEELLEEPAPVEAPKTGISMAKVDIDYGKILTILGSVALIAFLVWAVAMNVNTNKKNRIIAQSQMSADRTVTEKSGQTAEPAATASAGASGTAAQTPMMTGAYSDFVAKLNQAKTYSDTGDHINAMKTVNIIKGYNFNQTDAAKLNAVITASRRPASYSSYYLGYPFVESGDYKSAIPYIDDAIAFGGLEENTEWVEFLDAKLYFLAGKNDDAKAKFTAFAEKYPSSTYMTQVNDFLTQIGSKK